MYFTEKDISFIHNLHSSVKPRIANHSLFTYGFYVVKTIFSIKQYYAYMPHMVKYLHFIELNILSLPMSLLICLIW